MNCYDMIYGNDYYDLIVRNTAYLPPLSDGICGLDVGNNYTILFVSRDRYPDFRVANYHYNAIPNCYQPLSMEALDAAGILQVRENPALGLDGKGVLIGFLDSGIDTTHPAFLDAAGESRIVAVWDQNYVEENEGTARTADDLPQPYYGRVYGKDRLSVYGNRDATGHGTYVASVAAGSDVGDHSGAAPAADIAMVHLKEAKPYLRQYYFIPEDATCYAENDIMFGIQFLDELARMRGQALVICMSLGCGLSSHSGNNSLALYLNDLAVAYRRCVVTATGNLAAARKHFQGVFTAEDIEEGLGKKAYRQVEVVVEEDVCGFVMEQWCLAPARYEVAIVSPSGEVHPAVGIQTAGSQIYDFPLDGTTVEVDYSFPEATAGNQLIYYRFTKPAQGIWRIRVYSENGQPGEFHMYLPGQALTCGRIYFLASNPDTTIMNPANANRVLTIAGYNAVENAILLESGRGYTIDRRIKPDLAAPGYAVEGAVAGRGNFPAEARYERRTGTSGAVAIASGAAALYLQWCDRRQDTLVNTTQVKIFLIRGARAIPGDLYPNRQWGYGALDLYESFRRI